MTAYIKILIFDLMHKKIYQINLMPIANPKMLTIQIKLLKKTPKLAVNNLHDRFWWNRIDHFFLVLQLGTI